MTDNQNISFKLLTRMFDFAVLGSTFFLSCLMLSMDMVFSLLMQALVYATILVLFVHLASWISDGYTNSVGTITKIVLSNAAGILAGTSVMYLIEKMFSASNDILTVVVFSGVMAFFVLGTLTPIIHRKSTITH